MSQVTDRASNKVRLICFTALFAALTCIGTFISVPLPIGYFNLGDIFVLTGAYFLGPIFGAAAAGIGSALADLFMGFAVYAPATFIIKALVAMVAVLIFAFCNKVIKNKKWLYIAWFICAVIAECVMVGGYFLYESLVLGYGLGAAASIVGNCMQGLCGSLGATLICSILGGRITIRKS